MTLLTRKGLPFVILIATFFFFSVTDLNAQKRTSFSNTKPEFLTQLKEFMTSSKREVMEDLFKEFEKQFKGGAYTDEEFQIILETSNNMLGQRMTASPYFSDYLKALMLVKKSEDGEARFLNWHEILNSILGDIEKRKMVPFTSFQKFSIVFFEKGSLRYSKGSVEWLAKSNQYEMVYEEKQPLIKYEKLDLVATRKADSLSITETSGIYHIGKKEWRGKGGKVSWERVGLVDVFAELGEYTIDCTKSLYEVPNVKFHYLSFLPKVIEGTLTDKIMSGRSTTEGSYPRFESIGLPVKIDNIGGGIKYAGEFKLHGRTVYGYGSKEHKAQIEVYNENTNELLFKGASNQFVINKDEKVVAEQVETVLYFGQDSIYHPSVNIKFMIPDLRLYLYRGKRGSDRNPFYSSFHQMNINTDKLDWYIKKDSVYFGKRSISIGNKSKSEAVFESFRFFEEGDFRKLQNISTTNPISTMKLYSEEAGSSIVNANDLAARLNPKWDASSIQSLLYTMVADGFLNYDSESETVEFKEKLFHYASANNTDVDYDILKLKSVSKETNGVMALANNQIVVADMTSFELSHTQKVAAKPHEGQVVIKKNRDMDMNGKVFAGFASFSGKDYHFDYDNFNFKMDSIRYFDLFIPTDAKDENDEPIAMSIASRIEHLNGTLLIDAPSNKSGKEDIEMFPAFSSGDKSFVYYDKSETQNGCYKRDSFYFHLDKFSFNSLDNFVAEDVSFKGALVSAEIFPDIKEKIVLREEDQSLGFVHNTEAKGLPNYKAKGNYNGTIDLSNAGLLGLGTLKYLGATIDSEDIVFKPKQLTCTAKEFNLAEDRSGPKEFPQAKGYDVSINWRPYKDSMYVSSQEKPFDLFKESLHTLEGLLILTPDGLKGRGLFEWDKGSLSSALMDFGAFSTKADTSSLRITAIGQDDLALSTSNVYANLDFDKQIGHVKANSDDLSTELPFNQYVTSMNEFDWDMKNENITFKTDKEMGQFLSIHPDQDSLEFYGKTAFYDLKTNLLQVGGVPYLKSADAFIYTETGDIEINPGGKMTRLENAKIVADTIKQNHVINRATVDVNGRKDYSATGFYEYNLPNREQEIKFDKIVGARIGKGARHEKNTSTRATGEVKEEDDFYIDRRTEFRGTIKLDAQNVNLSFEGFARLDAPKLIGRQWFSINSEGDKEDLKIEYDVPKNYKGDPLRTGIYVSKETAQIYTRIMMPKFLRKDRPIIEARGLFDHDNVNDAFVFGDSIKLALPQIKKGNILTYGIKDSKVDAEGKLELCSEIKYVSVDAAGTVNTTYGLPTDSIVTFPSVYAEAFAGLNLIVPEKAMKIMANDFASAGFAADNIDYAKHKDFYEKALSEIIDDDKKLFDATNDMNRSLSLKMPKKYNEQTFLFSKLSLKWDPDYQSFVTINPKIPVAAIGGTPLNKVVEGYVEFKMPTNKNDRLYVYLKSPSDYIYFFGYKDGIMNIWSNNTKFQDEIINLKKKEAFIKMDDGELYEIVAGEQGTATAFRNRVIAIKK